MRHRIIAGWYDFVLTLCFQWNISLALQFSLKLAQDDGKL